MGNNFVNDMSNYCCGDRSQDKRMYGAMHPHDYTPRKYVHTRKRTASRKLNSSMDQSAKMYPSLHSHYQHDMNGYALPNNIRATQYSGFPVNEFGEDDLHNHHIHSYHSKKTGELVDNNDSQTINTDELN